AREVEVLTRHGLVLGVDKQTPYAVEECTLDIGDRAVIYTDGLTEATICSAWGRGSTNTLSARTTSCSGENVKHIASRVIPLTSTDLQYRKSVEASC
ncbi:MAG TPA: SpoIIE family protein phosphatase, partial [Candidatus Tumulicola sp.]